MGSDPDPVFKAHVEKHFSSLMQTMFTLIHFIVVDNMSDVYGPLVEKDPWLTIYFVLLILVISIVLMNLLSAVIFSCTLDQNTAEQDAFRKAQETEWTCII